MNPFEGNVQPAKVARMMRDPSRIASFLTEDVPGVDASGAAIFCDIINVMRADVRMMANAHDIEGVDVRLMSEDRAAELIAGVVDGDGYEIVEVFNEVAEQRDAVLKEALEEDEYQRFMEQKATIMQTADPDTFGALEDGEDGEDDDAEAGA